MARYIDADKLIKKIFPYNGAEKKSYTINAQAVYEAINNAPTEDVEEVVRCKDCGNSKWCDRVLYCSYFNKNVNEDDFCSQSC